MVALAAATPANSVPVFTADGQINPAVLALPVGAEARLELPGGSNHRVLVQAPRHHPGGNVTWRGHLLDAGGPGYVVTLTGDRRSGLFGTALTPAGAYRISPASGAWNAVRITPMAGGPIRTGSDAVRFKGIGAPTASVRVSETHGQPTVLNVVFRYTASARQDMDIVAWRAYLDDLIAVANEAFEQSDTLVELVRVGEQSVSLSETGSNAEMLEVLRDMSDVEDARLLLNGHFVVLVREWQSSHDTCGAAFVPVCGGDADCHSDAVGFSTLSVRGACPALEFAHQIGHNLGAAHEPADGMTGTFPYAHGHVTAGGVGTVMSVGGTSRVAWFSSPDLVECGGVRCGVEEVSDNVRALEQTRQFVERWVSDRSIRSVDPDPRLVRTVPTTLRFEPFGLVGRRFDIDLVRNGEFVTALTRNGYYPDKSVTVTVPSSVIAGSGYALSFRPVQRRNLEFEMPVSVVDPPPAALLAFTDELVEASGTGGDATLSVGRSGVTQGRVEVEFATVGGSASGNFTPTTGTLVWNDGDTTAKTITVRNIRSAESGQQTSIFVALTNPSEGARLGEPARAEIRVAARAGGGGGRLGGWALMLLAALGWVGRRGFAR